LLELHTLDVFYTPLEERFERITRSARRLLKVPVAAVTILSRDKQWFKSVNGWAVSELPIKQSLCTWTVHDDQVTIIPDTRKDPRFAQHPLVIDKPRFRFYVGCPLRDKTGAATATFCVFDIKPRSFSAEDMQSLRDMSAMAQQELLSDQLSSAQAELVSKLGVARREALFDPLTRVWNRRGATPFLRTTLAKAEEDNTHVSVCAIDLDKFKHINDSYGHQAGDKVLSKLAALLVSSVRPEDIVCRYGGDEFILILPGVDGKRATQIAERARRIISESPIRTRDGDIYITISIGCASRNAGEHISPEDLIRRADSALLSCKASGRNRVGFAGNQNS
jgi:diguanylate cyclase (GGDEF)-like protein